MRIEVNDPNGHKILILTFPLLGINISKGRRIIIRSIATQNGFLTGTSVRKDANGISYIEILMRPETEEKNVSFLAKGLVKELL